MKRREGREREERGERVRWKCRKLSEEVEERAKEERVKDEKGRKKKGKRNAGEDFYKG